MKKLFALLLTISFLTFAYANDIFKIKTINGKNLTFVGTERGIKVQEYKGKVILLEFWGTWCGPCLLSIPHHEELQEKYKDKLQVIAFETTPTVTAKDLVAYVNDPATHIDFSRVDYYLNEKAKTPAQKASLQQPIKDLKAFIKAKKKITYDVVAYNDGKEFIEYVARRANWPGFIPYLLIMDKNGNLAQIIPGMPNGKALEEYIKSLIK